MATTHYYLKGTCKWAKPYKMDDTYRNYSVDVYLDEPSMKLFIQSGAQLKIRTDSEGKQFVSFKRPHERLVKGEPKVMGPIPCMDASGYPWREEVLIGNGSTVEIKLAVYDTIKGKGTLLESIRVVDLVEYTGGTDDIVLASTVSDPF